MSTLIIVESPTKAKTITKFLGKGYTVTSSFGHVRDLPKSKMGIDIEGGTFEPDYVVAEEKEKTVKDLKSKAKKAKAIIFATDDDREGEAISWHLAQLLDIDPKKAKRIVFHEITKHAVEQALEKPRHLDMNLVHAQQARRVLDRLVGYELSPLLWKKVARGLSAGRVQSAAVRLIVERERERKAFKEDEYWTLEADFSEDKTDFIGKLSEKSGKKLKKLDIGEKKEMDKILKDLKGADYKILSIEKKQQKRNPPPPFRTSTLQQAANNQLGMGSRQSMRIAQQLYEGIDLKGHGHVGLITYMRTDSTNMSPKFLGEANDFVKSEYGDKYTLDKPRVYKSTAKGAQEAHEAIRPTDATLTPTLLQDKLTPQQYKLYSLIWRRALATQMAAAQLDAEAIDIKADKYTFRATGQLINFDGWLKLYPKKVKENALPQLKEGKKIDCKKLRPEQHFTEPPARYSDATLVKILEELGIGRPSTYAPTIHTVEARGYVERDDNKRLYPTDIAMVVNDMLVEHFKDVVDYDFTAEMEDNLDKVEEGDRKWAPLIKKFYGPFHKLIVDKTEHLKKEDVVHAREIGIDPKTKKPVSARVGRFGPFVQLGTKDDEEKPRFASLEKGQSVETVTLKEALHLLSLPRVLGNDEDGNEVISDIGRFGPYVKANNKYYSLKEDDPYKVDLKTALKIIAAKKKEEANKIIQDFKEEGIQVLNGRYGPYITDGTKNAKMPKDVDPKKISIKQCKEELEKAPAKGKRRFPQKK